MPLPIQTFFGIVSSVVPFCHQIPLLALLWSSLSDRKALDENPFFSHHQLYRKMGTLCPFVLSVLSRLFSFGLTLFAKGLASLPLSVDTTVIRRNGTKLPFVKKTYDPLVKKGVVGQVIAIACVPFGRLAFPVGFVLLKGQRKEGLFVLLSRLSFPCKKVTLLLDGGLMSKEVVKWVKEKKGWHVAGVIRRNMKVVYRGREGRVDEIVDRPKVVTVLCWGCKVLCVPFQRRNQKTYYLACTEWKLPAKKAIQRYRKRVQIEVLIRVLKQEMGIGKRLVRDEEKLKSWVGICLIGAWLIAGREGKNREKREEVKKAIEGYLSATF